MGRKANGRRRRREKKMKEIIPEERTQTELAESNFPDIPEEIVVDIRSRLPLKSLLRFTCVSKQWHSAISDIFAERIGGKMALIESTLWSGTIRTFHSIDKKCHVNGVSRPWNKKGPQSTYPKIVGSCNGLLLTRVHDDLFLWNPVTEYFKKVLAYAPLGDNGFRIASGLCYDSSAKEYNAVMVFSHENQDSKGGRFAVVGSFKSSSWRRVRCPDGVFDGMKSGPVVNEHLHWYPGCSHECRFRYCHHTLPSHTIMYFNIQMNEFHEVPMPEPSTDVTLILGVMRSRAWIVGLGVLDGCLCMVHENSINNNVEVLAMKEYGIRESWTTKFIIPNLTLGGVRTRNLELFGYTERGEVLMKLLVVDM